MALLKSIFSGYLSHINKIRDNIYSFYIGQNTYANKCLQVGIKEI